MSRYNSIEKDLNLEHNYSKKEDEVDLTELPPMTEITGIHHVMEHNYCKRGEADILQGPSDVIIDQPSCSINAMENIEISQTSNQKDVIIDQPSCSMKAMENIDISQTSNQKGRSGTGARRGTGAAGGTMAEGDGAGEDNLKLFWEHFFKAETGTYEKSTWLDLFLAEFLIRIKDGANAKDLINFCPVSGVVTLVGCELLCGIHRVTSSLNTHYTPHSPSDHIHDDDGVSEKSSASSEREGKSVFGRAQQQPAGAVLRRYLVAGVAWRCLALLAALPIEGLSCCRQLSSVLMWMYGELGGGGGVGGSSWASLAPGPPTAHLAPAPVLPPPSRPAPPIHKLFINRIWAKQKPLLWLHHGHKSNTLNASEARARRVSRLESPDKVGRKGGARCSDSSDSRASDEDLHALSRSLALHVAAEHRPDPARLDSPRLDEARRPKPRVSDYLTDAHRDLLNAELAPLELAALALRLLRALCAAESGLAGAEGSQVAMQALGFALRELCALQFVSASPGPEPCARAALRTELFDLVVGALDAVLAHPDLCARLINDGVLPMLLRLVEAALGEHGRRAPPPPLEHADGVLRLVLGGTYAAIAVLHGLLARARTLDRLREFAEQARLYGEAMRGGLLPAAVEVALRLPGPPDKAEPLVRALVDAVARLVGGAKRARGEVLHAASCGRARHKQCRARVAAGLSHHHDVLGAAGADTCCVARLHDSLAALLAIEGVASRASLRNRTLHALEAGGACCCAPPSLLVERGVRLAARHAGAARAALRLLERAVWGAGAAAPGPRPRSTAQLPCSVCEAAPRRARASFLMHYNALLAPDNPAGVLHATVAHLMRVAPRCRADLRHELLFGVMYPTFIVAKHRYLVRGDSSSLFLTSACLGAFATLLDSVAFAEQFVTKGGLSYVIELVALPEFSARCCAVLERAIVAELVRGEVEAGALPAVRALFRELEEATSRSLEAARGQFPFEEYTRLVDVAREAEELGLPAETPAPTPPGEDRARVRVRGDGDAPAAAATFWRCCAALCLYSPWYRWACVHSAPLAGGAALLRLALHRLTTEDLPPQEAKHLLKTFEAVLTVLLALEEVTGGRSKEVGCGAVRAAVGGAGGAGLRPLCEALVRVATAEPSPVTVMPRITNIKVPAAPTPAAAASSCGLDSAGSSECSSSSGDDTLSATCTSEHTDHSSQHIDTGYEADVEVGKFDLLPPYKNRRSSRNMAALTATGLEFGMSDEADEGGGERGPQCATYRGQGSLAHPELCIIVVDILTQLINKVMKSRTSGELEEGARVAGVQLARACAARLAAALPARAAAPPPALLQRLLAPPVQDLLVTTDPQLQELQRSVVELAVVVGSRRLCGGALASLLRLFARPAPTCAPAPLLAALLRLLPPHHRPDHILTFPIRRDRNNPDIKEMEYLGADFVHLTAHGAGAGAGVTSQSHAAEVTATQLCEAHLANGIRSIWSMSAARCGVGAGWTPWAAGFALHIWLATHTLNDHDENPVEGNSDCESSTSSESTPSPNKCGNKSGSTAAAAPAPRATRQDLLHVLSIGHDSLMFEMWLEPHTGALTVRLTRPAAGGCRVVSAARVPAAVSGRSAALAINVAETLHKRNMHIQVKVFVNGYELDTVSLPMQGILVRKAMATHVLLGHADGGGGVGDGGGGAYHVAGVGVYRTPLFTAPLALHLAAHGPDSSCMVKCEAPNFPPLLTPELLDSDIDWDQVFDMPEPQLRGLHEGLLLQISAHAPAIANLYHQTAPSGFPGRVTYVGVGGEGGSEGGGGGGGAPSIPEALFLRWAGAPLASRHHGLVPALHTLDGIDVLLYLYARVVELGARETEQATALSIVLRARSVDARLYASWATGAAADMVIAVLGATGARARVHWLAAVLTAATGAPVLRPATAAATGAVHVVLARNDAVLLDPDLLQLVARAADLLDDTEEIEWETERVGDREGGRSRERGSAWALALCCLSVLVRAQHPRRTFNLYQMQRVGLLDLLLQACKERFLNGSGRGLCPAACRSLVELVRGLLGAPPSLAHVAALADFLLLMHQASDTFVTHSRANFYFLLTPETVEMSEFPGRTRRATRRSDRKRRDTITTTKTDDVTIASDNSLSTSTRDEADKMDSSLDSIKQLKGFINMQIKEGRKHKKSSTSETSDTTAGDNSDNETRSKMDGEGEGKVEVVGEGEERLNEYVVVDEDDLNHTTVDLYSSGVYHEEGRVRAGAGAGFGACSALLLLLRDALLLLPEHALRHLQQGVCGVVSAETVAALANHRSGTVRGAVLRAAAALLARAPSDTLRRLKHQFYYIHLANQISLYEGTWELAEACAAFITERDVPLVDQLDDEVWARVTAEGLSRSAPLLALLAQCTGDVPLAHNVARLVTRVIERASLKQLAELYAAEAVTCAVRAAARLLPVEEGRALLLQDLAETLEALADKALSALHAAHTLTELHHLLSYIEWTAEGDEETAGVRHVHAALYRRELHALERRVRDDRARNNGYFATVLTSAVGAGGGGDPAARLLAVATRAVGYLTQVSARADLGSGDAALAAHLLAVLGRAAEGGRRAAAADALADLAGWALARREPGSVLRALHAAPPTALPSDPASLRRLAVYLLRALRETHATGGVDLPVTDWARSWALALQAGLPARLPSDTLPLEAEAYLRADEERWTRAAQRLRPAIAKVVFSNESVAVRVADTAMAATRVAVEAQNAERKRFMERLRAADARAAGAARAWQRCVATHAHEQGVWHDPASAPLAWQLDPTEGPGRVRVRLRRAHLRVPARLLQPGHRAKAEAGCRAAPLAALVAGRGRGALAARLRLHETVSYMARATHVTVAADTGGELLLSDRSVHFVPDGTAAGTEPACSWPLEGVVRVVTRRWCLREVAVELFMSSGHAQMLAFCDPSDRAAFLKALAACHLPAKIEPDSLSEAMSAWRSGTITNWEYLMRLNGLAGRSYNDLMQYPVLPFVLADYTSRILELTEPASFRDLSRPMAVQNRAREQHYINIYNDLKSARREGCSGLVSRQPHHYASLYSNSGSVLHYLVRVPPFTELFLDYQDDNFDMPDRTFHSLATTYRLITCDSPTDVKELIPELFYLPELFYNREGLALGVRQCGDPVDDVELPPWAADARLFTLIHRQALEARAVTEALPQWIDLVFGYKQVGQAAIDALNVFPACTYYGFDPDALEDEVDRTAAAAMVRTYGQAPRQLLRGPHPHRAPDLLHRPEADPPVWAGVRGARWGRYAGSPALPPPRVVARRAVPNAAALHALPAPRAVAAAPRNALLVPLAPDPPADHTYAILSWGHSDDIVRLKRRREGAPEPLLHVAAPERVTCAAASCLSGAGGAACPTLLGLASGRIAALKLRAQGGTSRVRVRPRSLLAHSAPITALYVCPRAALIVSASEDGKIVLWDLNELSYIRTLPNRDMSRVTAATVSATLSDVATVHATRATGPGDARDAPLDEPPHSEGSLEYEQDAAYKYKSLLRVHTVNATFVGSVKVPEEVRCVCYSHAPEGVSVNSVAAGLATGGVRLYSSWDLRPTLYVSGAARAPLVALTYGSECSLLFGCYEGGTVAAWEPADGARSPPVRIHPAHALC